MALTLDSYPVYTDGSGNEKNIFPGFLPVELVFNREDIQITSISDNAGFVRIELSGTIVIGQLLVGESIYFQSQGATYLYDASATVTNVFFSGTTWIDTDIVYIESTSSGYVNWKQNYFVELGLTREDNQAIDLLGFNLEDSGDLAGNITIDISLINDQNIQDYVDSGQVDENGRIKCRVQYREVWREQLAGSYTWLVDPTYLAIIIMYASEDFTVEDFNNDFDLPKIWDGYPINIGFIHSDENETGKIQITFDEQDQNKNDITIDNLLKVFDQGVYGQLFSNFNDIGYSFAADTRFVLLKSSEQSIPDFLNTDFTSDFAIT